MSQFLRMTVWMLIFILLLSPLLLALPRLYTAWYARGRLFQPPNAPANRVAIVFGAGLWRDGSPTPVLRDRVATAAELYFSGKVEKLLMSGDNQVIEYNEPGAMRLYAMKLGVPEDAIVQDFAGRRTYDTCYRARDIFGVEQAILVTQKFHLPRALYICKNLGIQAVGTSADRRPYRRSAFTYWNLRETLATVVAFWEVHVSHPVPILGNPEPIYPLEAQ